MSSTYPKVLILGQFFHKKSGSGITMTNLFMGWDKDRIAVAASELINPDYSVCENYYNLGESEIERGFPFNLLMRNDVSKSGVVRQKAGQNQQSNTGLNNTSISRKDRVLLFTGQMHRRRKFVCSQQFLTWIDEFSPDLIYSQLASYELIRFLGDLSRQINKPMVFHIMDDWPVTITISQNSLFRKHWETKIDKELRYLLSQANALMSISEYMSKEYYSRYGMEFIPFHNPIDVKHWLLPDKTYEHEGAFKLLYAGRIGTGLQNSLMEVAAAVGELNTEGLNIVFHIQATNDNPVLKQLGQFEFVSIRKPVPYNELPLIFGEADLLLLPNDFDQKSVSFLKYSMPTKASEYMASGTPVLVYSSIETAVTRHALQYHWAVVVSQNKKEVLKAAIKNIYADKDLRISLGNGARELAIQKFDSNIIRANFKSVLLNSIGKKNLQ